MARLTDQRRRHRWSVICRKGRVSCQVHLSEEVLVAMADAIKAGLNVNPRNDARPARSCYEPLAHRWSSR